MEGTGRFSAPRKMTARSLRMMARPIVISSGRHVPGGTKGAEGDFLDKEADEPGGAHAQDQGDIPGKVQDREGEVPHESPDHVHFTVGEGHQVHRPEDDDEPDGDQGVDASLGQTVDELGD